MLELEAVGSHEGATEILANVNLSWTRGLLAVVGGNGSGKSTLLRLIAGAKKPSSGTADWDGVALNRQARKRGKIGYGPQERNLDLAISLREFLCLCADLRGISPRSKAANDVAELLAMTPLMDEFLLHLSGGGRRKAMTAQALLGQTELLVLDEPTSEVDYTSSRQFWTVFQQRAQSAAVIVATHDLELALDCADSILLLQRGKPVVLRPAASFSLGELSAGIAGPKL
jgi:ABC-type multidrug transport system ATPase subunit